MNDFYTGADAVGQAIYTSLKLFQGEFWLDTQSGLPLFQGIIGQNGNPDQLRAVDLLVQEQILKVPGVTQIVSFASSYANRTYTITNCVVQTQYGDIPIEGVTFS